MNEDYLARLGLEVGGRYRDNVGSYEILDVQGEKILVRYDDGTTILRDAKLKARVHKTFQYEEKRKIPKDMEEDRWAYALGCIAAHGSLEAEVPPQAVNGFIEDYFKATGERITADSEGFYPITKGGYNKWGSELRIYFPAVFADNELFTLPPNVTIASGTSPENARINNNGLWWHLVEQNGFRIGSKQNVDHIRGKVPEHLREEFDAGVKSL